MFVKNPKLSQSIYDGLEFHNEAFENNKRCLIFTLKPEYNKIDDLIARHKAQLEREQEAKREAMDKRLKHRRALSVMQNRRSECLQNQSSTINADVLGQTDNQNILPWDNEEDSKVRSKLRKDVELAQTMNHNQEIPVEATNQETRENPEQQQSGDANGFSGNSLNNMASIQPVSTKLRNIGRRSITPGAYSIKTGRKTFLKTGDSFLRQTLYYDTRTKAVPKVAVKNQVIEKILDDEELIVKNPVLVDSIVKLRDMRMLKINQVTLNKFQGVGKLNYVYNDFHARSTNPGYSRKADGGFYNK